MKTLKSPYLVLASPMIMRFRARWRCGAAVFFLVKTQSHCNFTCVSRSCSDEKWKITWHTLEWQTSRYTMRKDVRFLVHSCIWEAIYIDVVKQSRGSSAQCRVDRGFAGFSLSFTSTDTYTRDIHWCARSGGCACTALCSVPVLILPHPPPPLPLPSPGPAGRPRKRVSERVRDPILHLPFLDRVVYLSLFVWLIYGGVTVSVFHSFLFPPRSTADHESVSCACVLATLRNPPAPSQRCTNSARRGYMSGHFRKRSISFKKSANHTLAGEKSVESFWETNFIKFI